MAKRKPSRVGSRPIWKGQISFGLVQIPVVLHSLERRHDLSFRLLDSRNHARIRYERVNEVTGEEVPWNEVVKAYEFDDKNYVVLTEEDFKRAAVEATKTIEIERFVDAEQIRPMFFDSPYFLLPDKRGEKGYALIREALEKTGKVGIARVVIRTREYISTLMSEGRALLLMLLRFQQELKSIPQDELPAADIKRAGISTKEVDMAVTLINSMSGDWKPTEFHDQYRDALMKWIEKKAKAGGKAPAPTPEETEAEEAPAIINIADLLEQSLKSKSHTRHARPKKRSAG